MWKNDHPFPNRKDLMYLSSITEKDASPKNKLYMKPSAHYLETSDIEGARPALKGYQYFNKPSYSNTTEDIERASPSKLHQKLEKPETNLITRDIDGAYPAKTGFQTKRIGTNPLNPVYNLPQFETYQPPAPKFIRDQISITDIPGTKPEVYYKWATRNTLHTSDIEGAQPKPEKQLNKPNFMDPKDINQGESRVYNRIVNPLLPEYLSRDKDGNLITIGEVEGSKPTLSVNTLKKAHTRHLDNSDILGSSPGTKGVGPVGRKERNYERTLVNSGDIEGAQSGSLKKGISTMRTTNPLAPSYNWKTDDVNQEQVKTQPVHPPADPIFNKNKAGFFGATPEGSVCKSPVRSQSSSRISSFHVNAGRFYAPDSEDPKLQAKNFEKNARQFFDNKVKTYGSQFENIHNPGSINRAKPKNNIVDVDSAQYQKNLKQFYFADSRPGSIANSDKSGSNADNYRFGLSRAEIGNPVQESRPLSDFSNKSEVRSQRSLFSAAAKQQLYN